MKTTVASVRKEVRIALREPERPPVSLANRTEAINVAIRTWNKCAATSALALMNVAPVETPEERTNVLSEYIGRVLPGYFLERPSKLSVKKITALEKKIFAGLRGQLTGHCVHAVLLALQRLVELVHEQAAVPTSLGK